MRCDCGSKLRPSYETEEFYYSAGKDKVVTLQATVKVWICKECDEIYSDNDSGAARQKAIDEYNEFQRLQNEQF